MLHDPTTAAPRADPLADRRGWVVAAMFYAAATVAFLWFAVRPHQLTTHLQTLDSVLIFAVMEHVTRALLGPAPLWEPGFFHPIANTLCLSEPMLLPAVIMAPVTLALGAVAAGNLYIYLCWFLNGLACWAYLRHLGAGMWAALWAGLFVAFCADKAWHVAGHAHLFFQAGFPLCLLAAERCMRPASSHAWATLFGVAFLFQCLAGFYMTAYFALWMMVMLPVVCWTAAGSVAHLKQALRRHAPQAVLWVAIALAIMGMMGGRYAAFGADFPQNSLESLRAGSATFKGWLLPPRDPERLVTLPGAAVNHWRGPANRGEDMQYLGIVAPVLLLVGVLFGVLAIGRRRMIDMRMGALAVVGAIAFTLSFGPFLYDDLSRLTRLPYAYLYGHFESLRFLRAPSRFAFVVVWAVALGGGIVMHRCLVRLHRIRPAYAVAGGVLAMAITVADFFPINTLYRVRVAEGDFVQFQRDRPHIPPYAEIESNPTASLVRFLQLRAPIANGYSGYTPLDRGPELDHFVRAFPSPGALALMASWQVDEVLVSRNADPAPREAAAAHPSLELLHSGGDGDLYRLVGQTPDLDAVRAAALARLGLDQDPSQMTRIDLPTRPDAPMSGDGFTALFQGFRQEADGALVSLNDSARLLLTFDPPLVAPSCQRLVLRLSVDNWYRLNEPITLFWKPADADDFQWHWRMERVLNADGTPREIVFDLSQSIPWVESGRIEALRIDLGTRAQNRVRIEEAWLE